LYWCKSVVSFIDIILEFFLKRININISMSIWLMDRKDLLPCLFDDFLVDWLFEFACTIYIVSNEVQESQKHDNKKYWGCGDTIIGVSNEDFHKKSVTVEHKPSTEPKAKRYIVSFSWADWWVVLEDRCAIRWVKVRSLESISIVIKKRKCSINNDQEVNNQICNTESVKIIKIWWNKAVDHNCKRGCSYDDNCNVM